MFAFCEMSLKASAKSFGFNLPLSLFMYILLLEIINKLPSKVYVNTL